MLPRTPINDLLWFRTDNKQICQLAIRAGDKRFPRVEHLDAALERCKTSLERHSRPLGRIRDRHSLCVHVTGRVGIGNDVPHQAGQQFNLLRQIRRVYVVNCVEWSVDIRSAVIGSRKRDAFAARHRYGLGIEGRFARDEVAPVLAVYRVNAIVKIALVVDAKCIANLLGILAAHASNVTEFALNIFTEIVEPPLVKDADGL